MPSLQTVAELPIHVPLKHESLEVQASPSLQLMKLLVCTQPVEVLQLRPLPQSLFEVHFATQTLSSVEQTRLPVAPPLHSWSVAHWQILSPPVLSAAQFFAVSGQSEPWLQVFTQIFAVG